MHVRMELGRGPSPPRTHNAPTHAPVSPQTAPLDLVAHLLPVAPGHEPRTDHAPACPTRTTSATALLRLLSFRTLLRPAGRSGGSYEAVEVVAVVEVAGGGVFAGPSTHALYIASI